jgi:hypothetical protein
MSPDGRLLRDRLYPGIIGLELHATKAQRPGQFAAHLKKYFAQVTVADRDGFDVAAAKTADVVLFDWGQGDSKMLDTLVPFGRLENWSKPTVLLNSAGLFVAGQWQLIGGAG